MSESINKKPCPNLFLFKLLDKSTGRMTEITVKAMCTMSKGHSPWTKCKVINPNDGRMYEIQGTPEELPDWYFKQQ